MKALSYEKVKYVTYSTCSIYRDENENVVKDVLKKVGKIWRTIDLSEVIKDKIPKKYRKGFHIDNELNSIRVCPSCGPNGYLKGFFCVIFERINLN